MTVAVAQQEPNAPKIVRRLGICISILTVALLISFAKNARKVKKPDEVQKAIKRTEKFLDILSAVIIYREKIGIRGKFEMN